MEILSNNMIYNSEHVRRQDRLLEEGRAMELLRTGEFGVLSMVGENGSSAYGVPLNFVWDGAETVYIHCAPQGRKLRSISLHPEVSFCIVGRTNVLPGKFTTEYESIVLDCTASIGLPAAERMEALKLILQKYSPEDIETGLKYAEKSFHRTEIIKLTIRTFSGKCKRVLHK